MKKLFLPLILLLVFVSCSEDPVEIDHYAECRPSIGELDVSKVDAVSGLIEFDIIPDKNYDFKSNNKGAVLTAPGKLWPNATIPYYFQGHTPYPGGGVIMGWEQKEHKDIMRAAIKELEAQTGLIIPEYESKEALLKEHKDGVAIGVGFMSNSAHKGRQGGIQSVKITFSLNPAHIKHEFLHTAGFGHEFQRSDRDEYVKILFENMHEHWHKQFEIDASTVDCGKYDEKSIMGYGTYTVPTVDSLPSIVTIDGEIIEPPTDLSEGDIATVKALYNLN